MTVVIDLTGGGDGISLAAMTTNAVTSSTDLDGLQAEVEFQVRKVFAGPRFLGAVESDADAGATAWIDIAVGDVIVEVATNVRLTGGYDGEALTTVTVGGVIVISEGKTLDNLVEVDPNGTFCDLEVAASDILDDEAEAILLARIGELTSAIHAADEATPRVYGVTIERDERPEFALRPVTFEGNGLRAKATYNVEDGEWRLSDGSYGSLSEIADNWAEIAGEYLADEERSYRENKARDDYKEGLR